MQRVPAVLKTRADHERVKDLFMEGRLSAQDRSRALGKWRSLLQGRWRWEFDKELDSEDDASSGEGYRVRKEVDDETGDVKRVIQEKRVEDPGARIFRMGFTVEEVEKVISEMEERHG